MDSKILKLIRYIKKIMPLKNDLSELQRKTIEELPTKTVSLFVSDENLAKELAVYYMITHNLVSHTEYILAEELVDMKFSRGVGNKSCYNYYADVFIIDISSLTKNSMAFSIINSFVKYTLNIPTNKCVIIFFRGDRNSYNTYKASQQNALEIDQCVFFDERYEVNAESNVDFDFVDGNPVTLPECESPKTPKTDSDDDLKVKQHEIDQTPEEKKTQHEKNSISNVKRNIVLNNKSSTKCSNDIELNKNSKRKSTHRGEGKKK